MTSSRGRAFLRRVATIAAFNAVGGLVLGLAFDVPAWASVLALGLASFGGARGLRNELDEQGALL